MDDGDNFSSNTSNEDSTTKYADVGNPSAISGRIRNYRVFAKQESGESQPN
jgi:hypothetical protein